MHSASFFLSLVLQHVIFLNFHGSCGLKFKSYFIWKSHPEEAWPEIGLDC